MQWQGWAALDLVPVVIGDDEVERGAALGFDILYLSEARAAVKRAGAAADKGVWNIEMAATSTTILLSATACEAYLSEHLAIPPFSQRGFAKPIARTDSSVPSP